MYCFNRATTKKISFFPEGKEGKLNWTTVACIVVLLSGDCHPVFQKNCNYCYYYENNFQMSAKGVSSTSIH